MQNRQLDILYVCSS